MIFNCHLFKYARKQPLGIIIVSFIIVIAFIHPVLIDNLITDNDLLIIIIFIGVQLKLQRCYRI